MPDAYVDDPDDVSSDKVASVVPNPIFLRWQDRYYDALDIVNNWRSSHRQPPISCICESVIVGKRSSFASIDDRRLMR